MSICEVSKHKNDYNFETIRSDARSYEFVQSFWFLLSIPEVDPTCYETPCILLELMFRLILQPLI